MGWNDRSYTVYRLCFGIYIHCVFKPVFVFRMCVRAYVHVCVVVAVAVVVARVHNIKREESVLLQYSLYKHAS